MNVLAALGVMAATHASGLYTEAGYDVVFSDRLALVSRSQRVIGEVGYFQGSYMGSYGFGTYWRYGVGFSWEPIILAGLRADPNERADETFAIQFYYPHLTLARGVDLFKVGLWGRMRLGPVWSVVDPKIFYGSDAVWGGQLTGELAVSYNVGSVFKIAPRVGVGLLIDQVRTSYQALLGLGIYLQAPFKRITVQDPSNYWEQDY